MDRSVIFSTHLGSYRKQDAASVCHSMYQFPAGCYRGPRLLPWRGQRLSPRATPCSVPKIHCRLMGSLLRTGWSVFPKISTYPRGFWRSDSNHLGDESVVRLEKGWYCDAVLPQYADQPALYLSSSCTSDLLKQFFTPLGGALGFFSV